MRKIVTIVCALIATSCLGQDLICDSTSYGACIMRDGSFVGINENEHFAMHSVMKFPQALCVADYLNRKGLDLDDTIVVDKFCGKPKAVEKYMRKLGFHDIHIRMTEEQIHKNPAKAIENSSTPAEMVRLFEWFYHHKDDNRYLTFIWKAMADCSTGLKRIPAAISADARIVHKTGTGFPSAEGLQDMNDAGIILMPNGSHAIIAIFTTHSSSEAVIANIARQLLDTIIK